MKTCVLSLLLDTVFAVPCQPEDILVAVASNFTAPMNQLVEEFEAATGHEVQLTFGSSGRFYAQISNGAPFQLFLSADEEKPRQLEVAGLTVTASRFTYAIGSLVLWSADPNFANSGPDSLDGNYRRLAMANPDLAPYGKASIEVLESLGKLDATRPRWVQGENIAQTYQFVVTGNAELGFVALSQVFENGNIKEGSGWIVPADLHSPIRQQAVLLSNGAACNACAEFFNYLKSSDAARIIQTHGYQSGSE